MNKNIPLEKKLLEMVIAREEESIEFLQKIISLDTTIIDEGINGNEGKTQNWIASIFKNNGYEVDIFEPEEEKIKKYPAYIPGHNYKGRPIIAAKIKGTGGGRSLLIDMHVDTVPIGNSSLWKHNPLGGELEDGKIYGRGAADMKAGYAGTIMAVDYIKRAGILLKGDLTMISVVDGEGGQGNGCLAYLDRGYRADGALFPEGTNLEKIVFGTHGLLIGKIKVSGKTVHPTIKWQGANAIEKAIKIITGLNALEKDWFLIKRQPELGPPKISIGIIKGGHEANSIPDECEIYIAVNFLPMEVDSNGRGTLVKKEVEDYISMLCKGDSWLSSHPAEVSWLIEISPSFIDRNHDLIKVLKPIADKTLGYEVPAAWGEFPSSASITNNIAKMPMIQFGPGFVEQAHVVDEWVSVDKYLAYIKIVSKFIVQWCGISDI